MCAFSFLSQPACFHPKRKRRMYRFASSGEIGAPCGVPLPLSLLTVVGRLPPLPSFSSTAICSHDLINASIDSAARALRLSRHARSAVGDTHTVLQSDPPQRSLPAQSPHP